MHAKLVRILLFGFGLVALSNLGSFAAAPAQFRVGEFTFERPSEWVWVAVTSPMRKAELKVVDSKSKGPAEVVFFAGFGGGVQANVERWFHQFQGSRDQIHARTEETTVGNRTVTYAQAEGTFLSGRPVGPKTPKADFAMLAAIIPSSQGDVFVKMTGPADLVKRSSAVFKKMIEDGMK